MKVALVLFDWFAHGGLQRDCRRIGESLLAAGAGADVICMHWQGEDHPGMHRVMPDIRTAGKVAARKRFSEFLVQHLAQNAYDAVIGFNRLPGLDYYFAADTCFAWKAFHERNLFYRWAPRNRQYLAFEKAVFGAHSKTRLLMLSPLQKQEYLACYPESGSRMIDLPPGIARDRMAPDNADDMRRRFREEFAIADSDLVVLQVGTGYPVKGVDRSLAAIAALAPEWQARTHFIVLGNDRHGRYAKRAATLGIASGITFLEGREDLPRIYQGADLLLQPSRKESAGMVLLEGIVAGLPVLTTATCGYAFHVEKADAGRVIPEPFTQQALNAALAAMLQDGEARRRWRDNGIRYGRDGDFYDMPDHVTRMVFANAGERRHAG